MRNLFIIAIFFILILNCRQTSFFSNLKCLSVISSKNPTKLLLENVNAIKKFYPECDIVIVDSDSSDFKGYEKIPKNVKIEYVKNKNYELGAWYYAYNKYPYYDYYMFIQDTFIPNSRIKDFDPTNGTTYTRFIHNVDLNDGPETDQFGDQLRDQLRAVYINSDLDFLVKKSINQKFIGSAHSALIADNETTKNILQLEKPYIDKNITKIKFDSHLAECTIGLMANIYSRKRIDLNPYFTKKNGRRL